MFSKVTLTTLLKELTSAQESIEKVSVWLLQFKEEAAEIVNVWKLQYSEGDDDKKLTLLYLANDVLQNSRRKGTHFTDAYGIVLPTCLAECKAHEVQITRMINIWELRGIFLNHVISAMRYNLDEFGMEDKGVKMQEVIESLEELSTLENESSDVLTKLSQRLDTTDFANAFNVTSKNEGEKFAADFDETALFLDEYCSCLSRQTSKRMSMLRQINTTMYQNEKVDETTKRALVDTKSKLTQLAITRKVIVERNLMIEEGMVNVGDDSPDEMNIENLTSEEEDVDIETVETGGKRAIQDKKDLNTSFNSHEDDGIHPEDAIDEQQPREVQQKSKKKHIRKELPTYDPRKILSYGFRLNPPTGDEIPVGFMVMPDGTLCAVPIASHMFLPKPEPEVGPKTPEEEPIKEDDGPKTPEIPEELEEGEVSESEGEEVKVEEVDGVPLNEAAPVMDYDEVDGEPFELPTHSVTSDEASSPGSAPSLPSPEVSDEEDPALVARNNVINWRQGDDFPPAIPVQQYPANAVNTDDTALVRSNSYNAAKAGENGQLQYADDVERPPDSAYSPNSAGSPLSPVKRDSAEEGELEEDNKDGADKLSNVMKGVSAYVGAFHPEPLVAPVEQSEYDQFYPPGYLNNARPPPPQPSSKPAYITTAPDENRMPHVPRSAPIRPPEPAGYPAPGRDPPPADRRPLFLQGGDRPPDHTRRPSYSMEDRYTPPLDEFDRRPVHRPCRPMSPEDRRYRGGPPSPNAYSRGPYSPDHHYPRSPGPPIHYPRPPVPYGTRPPYDARPSGPGYRHPPPLGTHRPPYLSNSPPYPDRRDMRRSPSHDRYPDPYHDQYRDKGLPPDHYNDHEDERFPKRHPEHFLGLGPRFITGSGGRCQASFVLSCVCICGVYELVVIVMSVLGRMEKLRHQLMVLCSLNPVKLKKEIPDKTLDVRLFVADNGVMKVDIIVCMMNGNSRFGPPMPHRPRPPGSHDDQPVPGVYGPPVPGPPPRSSNIFQAYQTRGPPGPPAPQQYHQPPEASRFGPPIPQQYPSHEQLAAEQRYGPPVPASSSNYGPPMPPVQRSTPPPSYGPPIPASTHSGYSSGVQTYQKVLPSPEVQAQMLQQAGKAPTYAQLEQQHQHSSSRKLEEPSDESEEEDSSSGSEYEDKIPNIPIQSYPKIRRPTPEPPAPRPSRFSSLPPPEALAIQSFPSFPTDAVPFQTYDVKSQEYTKSSSGPPEFSGVVPFDPFRTLPEADPTKFKPLAAPQESAVPVASFPSQIKGEPEHDTSINRIFALYNLDPSDDEKEETRSPPKGPSILQQVFGGQSLPPPVYSPSPERERAPKARRTQSPRPDRTVRSNHPNLARPAVPAMSRPAPPLLQNPHPVAPMHRAPAPAAPTRSRSKSMSISPPKEVGRKVSSKDPRLRKKSHEDRSSSHGSKKSKERRRHERRDRAARERAMRFGRSPSPVDPSKIKAQHDPVLLVKDLRQVLSAKKANESPKKVAPPAAEQPKVPIVVKTPAINTSIMYPFPILEPLPPPAPPAKVATEEEKAAVIARIQKMKEDNEREKQGILQMQENRAKQKAAIDAKINENMKLVPSIEAEAKSKYFDKKASSISDPLSSVPTSTATTTTTAASTTLSTTPSTTPSTTTTSSTTPTPAANNVVSAMAGLSKDQIKNLKESGAVSITSLPTFLQKAINPDLPAAPNVASNVVVDQAGSLIITSTPNQPHNLMRPPLSGGNMNNFCPRNPNQFKYNRPGFNNQLPMRPPGRPPFQPNNMGPGPNNMNMSIGQAANMGPMMAPGGSNMGPPGLNMWQGPPDFNNGWQQAPPQRQWDPNMGPPPQGQWDPNMGPPPFDPNMGPPQGQWDPNMGPPPQGQWDPNMGPPPFNPNMGPPGPNMGHPGPNMGVPGGNTWHGPPPMGNFPPGHPAYGQPNFQPPPHLGPGWQGPPPTGPAGPTVISAAPQLNIPSSQQNYPGTDTPAVTELPNKKLSYPERKQAEEERVKKQIEEIKRKNMMDNVKKKSAEIKQQLQTRITKTSIAARLGAAKSPGMTGRLGIKVVKVAPKKVAPKKVDTLKPNPSKKSSRFDVPPPDVCGMKVTVQFPPNQPSQLKQMMSGTPEDSTPAQLNQLQERDATQANTPAQLKQLLSSKPAPSNINIVSTLDGEEELDYNEDIDDLVDHSFGDALEFDL